jgi:uncharacterized membrane-anchored protein
MLLAVAAAFALPAALGARPAPPAPAEAVPPEAAAREAAARVQRIMAQLHPVTGDVRIPGANAVLHLGHDYYFLPANEARVVLTEGWGNPPGQADGVLGLVFPAGRTFADDTWGAVISYDGSGYVSDTDAASTDYAALMTQMQEGETEANAALARQGFPARHVVGWAQTPAYDARTHSVVWARNIQFSGVPENTLNYDIRMLGRRGVLSLNMVTVMSDLAGTRAAAQRFASAAEFVPGERYADYQAGTDRVAEYGVAGLVAAGVGATIAQKAGLFALILAFGKKIILVLIAAFALLARWIRRLFGKKREEEFATYEETEEPAPAEAPPQPLAEPAAGAVPAQSRPGHSAASAWPGSL